jgi:hypothetical protein
MTLDAPKSWAERATAEPTWPVGPKTMTVVMVRAGCECERGGDVEIGFGW